MSRRNTIKLCNAAVEPLKGVIPEKVYVEIDDLINKYDEWGVGMEMLFDTISEEEISISVGQFQKMCKAMEAMGRGDSHRIEYTRAHHVSS
jgi:alanyl-tRNA synthetase